MTTGSNMGAQNAEPAKPRKAFVVSEDMEGRSVIVFAQHNVVARREGANELNTEFEYVECRRAPEFDSHAEKGFVPRSVLMGLGWWFTCHGPRCEKQIFGGEDTYIIDADDRIFCSHKCHGERLDDESYLPVTTLTDYPRNDREQP